ncbi:MAG: AAA family ATPase [Actinomycetota bacterium]|nr:AAA family ATPase [Actinomycetota bacterium]
MSFTSVSTTAPHAAPDGLEELFWSRLAIVTGKGGVGKTTFAAALGLAAASSGRRTLLVEVEGRQSFSRIFRTQPWDYREREFRPDLFGVAIDPHDAMYEYLELFYGLKRVSWVMSRVNALDFVTAAAPGLRDLLLVGKVYEIEKRRRRDGRPVYDFVVLDAPPTGKIVPFLQAPDAVTEIVRVGPIRRQAGNVIGMLEDPRRARVVVVTLLEEMPVAEGIEAVGALRDAELTVGPIVANRVLSPRLGDAEFEALTSLGPAGLIDRARQGGISLSREAAELAIEQVVAHGSRVELEHRMRKRLLDGTGSPLLELPLLTRATFEPADLEVLAERIAMGVAQGGPLGGDGERRSAGATREEPS